MVNENARKDPEGVIVRASDGFLCVKTLEDLKKEGGHPLGTKKAVVTKEVADMTVKELRALCKTNNVSFTNKDKRDVLVKKLESPEEPKGE